jgi:hypothetical protein
VKKQQDLEENNFGFVDISHRRYKLRRDVEQTPTNYLIQTKACNKERGRRTLLKWEVELVEMK